MYMRSFIAWSDKCLTKGYWNRERGEGSHRESHVDTWGRASQREGRADAKALR